MLSREFIAIETCMELIVALRVLSNSSKNESTMKKKIVSGISCYEMVCYG